MPEVLIAIQARSGSKRLPGKSLRLLDDKIMVGHVFQTAQLSASFMNRAAGPSHINSKVCLLIPEDDPLKEHFDSRDIIEGSESDVLSRFQKAVLEYNPDYIVRLTGDCPLIIPTIITKHVVSCIGANLDYCSNAYEDLRTFVDGYDVEVISRKAFDWVAANATSASDREHVTTYLRREQPRWASFGVVISHTDLSDIKISVDTVEDFEDVEKRKLSLNRKNQSAKERGYAVFRF